MRLSEKLSLFRRTIFKLLFILVASPFISGCRSESQQKYLEVGKVIMAEGEAESRLSDTITPLVKELESIDISKCPADFRFAYNNYLSSLRSFEQSHLPFTSGLIKKMDAKFLPELIEKLELNEQNVQSARAELGKITVKYMAEAGH